MDEKPKIEKVKWEKPVLVVIGRGKPEERVLAVCKSGQALGPSMTAAPCNANNECYLSAGS